MVAISPVDESLPHIGVLSCQERPGTGVSFYLAGDSRSSHHRCDPGTRQGSSVFFDRSSRVGALHFPWRVHREPRIPTY